MLRHFYGNYMIESDDKFANVLQTDFFVDIQAAEGKERLPSGCQCEPANSLLS